MNSKNNAMMFMTTKKPVPDNIPNPKTQRDTPTYKPWGWNDIDHRKVSGQHHERDRMSDFGE